MANNSIVVKPQGQTQIIVGNSANRTPIVVNPSSSGCSGGGGNINITPYITEDGSSVVFNYFTPKQMEKVYIWLEGGNLWFELTKDEEGQYSLTTKSDIQELDGMFIVGGEEFIVNTIVDSFIVDLKGYKVSEVRIEGIDADLLDADFTWKLAEIGNKVNETAKESTSQEILEEVQKGGGSVYPTIQMVETTAAIEPNKVYIWGEVESLDITLIDGEEGVANVYFLEFYSGNVATRISLPQSITNVLGIAEINKIVNIAIYNNTAYIV